MRRRTLLKQAGSVAAARSVLSKRSEPLRIGFFVSDDVRAAEPINSVSRAAQRHLSPLTEKTLRVGPEGVVEVPQKETIAEMTKWWSTQTREFDVNILCVGPTDWDHVGYALYNSPHCVLTHTFSLDREWGEWLACHEIAHVLGARHYHANGTIMEPRYEDVERMEYSEQTKSKIRSRNIMSKEEPYIGYCEACGAKHEIDPELSDRCMCGGEVNKDV